MNTRNLFYLGIIVITGILLMSLIFPPVSAYTYVLAQGDTAYIGDTVDLSLAATWPDYQLAWCSDQSPGCAYPEIVDTSNFNQHRVILTEDRWNIGMYYRWDGHWNPGENLDAFEILPGSRPTNITYIDFFNTTMPGSVVTSTPPIKSLPNSTHIILARGDNAAYNYAIPNTTAKQSGYIWVFGESKGGVGSQILGEPLEFRSNDSVYIYDFNQSLSESLTYGIYTGYLQFSGKNGFQDVFYRKDHKVGDSHVQILDTPYDDDVIADVPLNGFIPVRIQQEFETLAKPSMYSDDQLVQISMLVEQPNLILTEYYEMNDTLIISGTTNMADGTEIVFKIDPDNYALKSDIKAHTWTTTAYGGIDKPRQFNIELPIEWGDLSVSTHTIVATIDKNRIHVDTHKDFKVSDVFVFPTPTPAREKVVLEDYGWHRVTPNATQTVTITSKPAKPVTPTVTQTVAQNGSVVTDNSTVQPVNTTIAPTKRPTPKPTEAVTVPIWWTTGVAAVVGVMIWRKR